MRPKSSPHVGQLTAPSSTTTQHATNFGQLSPECMFFITKGTWYMWISENLFLPIGKILKPDGRSGM